MAALTLLLASCVAFAPSRSPSCPQPFMHSTSSSRLLVQPESKAEGFAGAMAADPPLGRPDGLPRFSWATVAIFALNPAAFLALPLVAVTAFKFNVLGAKWAVDRAALQLGAVFTAPVLALTLMPLERLPGLSSLVEVSRASKTICLYAFGSRLVPLRASAAALVLASSAALFEELAFRGTMMGGIEALATRVMPARASAVFALAAQAVVFGRLHSYTNSASYFIAATIAGAAFGGAYLCSRNLAVPIVMHFIVDMVSFAVCHVQVARSRREDQIALVNDPSPIAAALRRATGTPLSADVRTSSAEGSRGADMIEADAIAAEAGEAQPFFGSSLDTPSGDPPGA